MDPEVSPGGGLCPALLVGGQGVQHPADDLVGHQEAPGRQAPAAVLLHGVTGPGALAKEGQEAGRTPKSHRVLPDVSGIQ